MYIKYLKIVKQLGYKYIKTNYLVDSSNYAYFDYYSEPYSPVNPIDTNKNCVVVGYRYIQLIIEGKRLQHLKKPIKIYTTHETNSVYEISGVTIFKSSNPLVYLTEIIVSLGFKNTAYVEIVKKNFYLTRKYSGDGLNLQLGLIKHDDTMLLKKLGYRDLYGVIYFTLTL